MNVILNIGSILLVILYNLQDISLVDELYNEYLQIPKEEDNGDNSRS